MRVDRHTTTLIVDRNTAMRAVNNPFFVENTRINEDTYELRLRKRRVASCQPRQIGLMVYSLAKKELLSCYFNLIDKYIARENFQLILCDTDSIYLGLSGPSLRACVRPDMVAEFDQEIRRWMPQYYCERHYAERQVAWNRGQDDESEYRGGGAAQCCLEVQKYQRRTPGLWKVECAADAVIALAPKCYTCFNFASEDLAEDDTTWWSRKLISVKSSHKGVQKSNVLTPYDFWSVQESTKPRYIINRGIKKDFDKQMKTYRQEKRGLSYLYTKRQVLSDGISTIPLQL